MLKKGDVVYMVKYALSKGIKSCIVEYDQIHGENICLEGYFFYAKLGRDIVLSKDDAIKAAEKIRGRKIQSLKKQLAKFENMKFEI